MGKSRKKQATGASFSEKQKTALEAISYGDPELCRNLAGADLRQLFNVDLQVATEVYERLAEHKNVQVRATLARNLDLKAFPKAAESLAEFYDDATLLALIDNPTLSHRVSLSITQSQNFTARYTLASSERLKDFPEAAAELVDDDLGIRCALAKNPALAELPATAMLLTKFKEAAIRQALIGNPALEHLPDVALYLEQNITDDGTWEALEKNPGFQSLREKRTLEAMKELGMNPETLG
ncbi:MAG TPA: hypothetical protein DEA55_06115 [Rhodospirillaceae bacterium]|nr:hypothetical protein [Rhodospirillaceae bacterium]